MFFEIIKTRTVTKYKMTNVFFKIIVAAAILLGVLFLLKYFLDIDGLEGHGEIQEKEFERIIHLVDSIESVKEYKIFRPKLSDGRTPSSNIQGYFSTDNGNFLHTHLTTYIENKKSKSLCLDWTINGMGIECEKNKKQIHPCNAGSDVLQEFSFYTLDIEAMIGNEISVLQKLESTKNSAPSKFGDTICRSAVKFSSDDLATAMICFESDAYCRRSQKK